MRIDPKLVTADWPKGAGRTEAGKETEDESSAVTVSVKATNSGNDAEVDAAAESAARRARVAELRSLVESGAYSVDLDELARRLVQVIGRLP